jgi:hypothetical protein
MRRYSSKAAFALAKAPAKSFPLKAPPLKYTTTTVASVNNLQLAAVDDSSSPISSLALVLPTGPRHQVSESEQGVAQWLKHAAFKSTNTKSTLAIAREAEILGHRLTAALGREELVLAADFRRDDLPDVVALFANILRGFTERDNAPWGIYTREQVSLELLFKNVLNSFACRSERVKNGLLLVNRQKQRLKMHRVLLLFLTICTGLRSGTV